MPSATVNSDAAKARVMAPSQSMTQKLQSMTDASGVIASGQMINTKQPAAQTLKHESKVDDFEVKHVSDADAKIVDDFLNKSMIYSPKQLLSQASQLFDVMMKDERFGKLKKAFASFALMTQVPLAAHAEEVSKVVQGIADYSASDSADVSGMRMAYRTFMGGRVSFTQFKELLDAKMIREVILNDAGQANFLLFDGKKGLVQVAGTMTDLLQ